MHRRDLLRAALVALALRRGGRPALARHPFAPDPVEARRLRRMLARAATPEPARHAPHA